MNPQTLAVLAEIRSHLTWRRCVNLTAGACVLVVLFAAYIFHTSQHKSAPPVCGVALPYDPFAARAFRLAEQSGGLVAAAMYGPPPSTATIKRYVDGTLDVLKWWFITFTNPIRGFEHFAGIERGGVNPYTVAQPCVPPAEACVPDEAPEAPAKPEDLAPWDPKMASLQGLGGLAAAKPDEAIVKTAIRIGKERGLPDKALVIILAAGYVESGIRNLDYGDRDSVGWLQQRAGWGTAAQRMDPAYAAGKFYDALVKVPSWQSMGVGEAAQAVQISAFPDRYADWQDEAEGLVARLAGTSSTPDTSTRSEECTPGLGGISAMTWNAKADNSPARINAGIRAANVDLAAVQEIRRNGALSVPGFGVTRGDNAVPILWRRDTLDLVRQGRDLAFSEGQRVGWDHADRQSRVGPKSVVWAIFRNRATGQSFAAINTHLLVGSGRDARRQKLWERQVRVVKGRAATLRAQGLPVMILGDFNANPGKVGRALPGETNWEALGRQDTHYGRTLDYVVTIGATPASQRVLSPFGSDHHRVKVTYAIPHGDRPAATMRNPAEFDRQGNPRTVAEAIAWFRRADATEGVPGEQVSNRCERYQNLAYGLSGGYSTARAHWEAAGPKHAGTDTPPAGALVYWDTSNSAGHVALSVGGGRVISTDYNAQTGQFQTGLISEGPITDLDKWGARLGYRAPNFNVGSGK